MSELLKGLKVAELRQLCKEQKLTASGTKPELLARLQEAGVDGLDTVLGEEDGDQELGDDDLLDDELDDPALDLGLDDNSAAAPSPLPRAAVTAPSADDTTQLTTSSESTESAKRPVIAPIAISADDSPEPKIGPAKITSPTGVTAPGVEKIAARAARFGGSESEEAKKALRAAKFGHTETETKDDKKAARAAKFGGTAVTAPAAVAPVVADGDIVEKKASRAARFGLAENAAKEAPATDDALATRAARFSGTSAEEQEKITKRKERFGATLSTTCKPIPVIGGDDEAARKRARLARFNS